MRFCWVIRTKSPRDNSSVRVPLSCRFIRGSLCGERRRILTLLGASWGQRKSHLNGGCRTQARRQSVYLDRKRIRLGKGEMAATAAALLVKKRVGRLRISPRN